MVLNCMALIKIDMEEQKKQAVDDGFSSQQARVASHLMSFATYINVSLLGFTGSQMHLCKLNQQMSC